MSSTYSFEYSTELKSPWCVLPQVALGEGSTALYVMVHHQGAPRMVLALNRSARPEYWFRQDVIFWNDLLVVGVAERIYLVTPSGDLITNIILSDYFCEFNSGEDWLLTATGTCVHRLDNLGRLVWTSPAVANDGVVIGHVAEGLIQGEGEWDPPNGWRSFSLNLADGTLT